MAVIPLPRLDLDSGRIERDIRGSLMQTPDFLFHEDEREESKSLNGERPKAVQEDDQVQDMFVSFLAFGGVNTKKELNHRATIIHISMMTRKYYLVPAPWLNLETADSFFGNWMLNFDRDNNLITAVGKHRLHRVSLNQNIQKISLTDTQIAGYQQILSMSHNQLLGDDLEKDAARSYEKQGMLSDCLD